MPERSSSTKKQEMETYRKLHLGRENKSFVRRRRVEEGKLYFFIGDKNSDRPWLKVLRADYLRQWRISAKKIHEEIPPNAPEELMDFYKLKIEHEVYDLLASRHALMINLDAEFLKQNGRRMTPHEKSVYASTSKRCDEAPLSSIPISRAKAVRKLMLNDLVQKIEDLHRHHPQSLQQAWAQIVGEEAAQETLLEKVDAQNGMAYCRCMNPSLRFKIQKIKDLPQKLSQTLSLNVKRVLFR